MSNLTRYKDFLKLLERWPVEPTKSGRDLGERIRHCIKAAYDPEKGLAGDPKECDRQYKALKNLCDNSHCISFKRNNPYTSTGLTPEECKLMLTNETLSLLEKEDKNFLSRFKFNRDK